MLSTCLVEQSKSMFSFIACECLTKSEECKSHVQSFFFFLLPHAGNQSLTLHGPNSFFGSFSGHNLREALFVYRLIGATLIGNFFDDPFFKWN